MNTRAIRTRAVRARDNARTRFGGGSIGTMPDHVRAFAQLGDAIAATLARRYPGTRWRVLRGHGEVDRAPNPDTPSTEVRGGGDGEPGGNVGIANRPHRDTLGNV
jgi:hypothetical protein